MSFWTLPDPRTQAENDTRTQPARARSNALSLATPTIALKLCSGCLSTVTIMSNSGNRTAHEAVMTGKKNLPRLTSRAMTGLISRIGDPQRPCAVPEMIGPLRTRQPTPNSEDTRPDSPVPTRPLGPRVARSGGQESTATRGALAIRLTLLRRGPEVKSRLVRAEWHLRRSARSSRSSRWPRSDEFPIPVHHTRKLASWSHRAISQGRKGYGRQTHAPRPTVIRDGALNRPRSQLQKGVGPCAGGDRRGRPRCRGG